LVSQSLIRRHFYRMRDLKRFGRNLACGFLADEENPERIFSSKR